VSSGLFEVGTSKNMLTLRGIHVTRKHLDGAKMIEESSKIISRAVATAGTGHESSKNMVVRGSHSIRHVSIHCFSRSGLHWQTLCWNTESVCDFCIGLSSLRKCELPWHVQLATEFRDDSAETARAELGGSR
jgi:hypothetical protein